MVITGDIGNQIKQLYTITLDAIAKGQLGSEREQRVRENLIQEMLAIENAKRKNAASPQPSITATELITQIAKNFEEIADKKKAAAAEDPNDQTKNATLQAEAEQAEKQKTTIEQAKALALEIDQKNLEKILRILPSTDEKTQLAYLEKNLRENPQLTPDALVKYDFQEFYEKLPTLLHRFDAHPDQSEAFSQTIHKDQSPTEAFEAYKTVDKDNQINIIFQGLQNLATQEALIEQHIQPKLIDSINTNGLMTTLQNARTNMPTGSTDLTHEKKAIETLADAVEKFNAALETVNKRNAFDNTPETDHALNALKDEHTVLSKLLSVDGTNRTLLKALKDTDALEANAAIDKILTKLFYTQALLFKASNGKYITGGTPSLETLESGASFKSGTLFKNDIYAALNTDKIMEITSITLEKKPHEKRCIKKKSTVLNDLKLTGKELLVAIEKTQQAILEHNKTGAKPQWTMSVEKSADGSITIITYPQDTQKALEKAAHDAVKERSQQLNAKTDAAADAAKPSAPNDVAAIAPAGDGVKAKENDAAIQPQRAASP